MCIRDRIILKQSARSFVDKLDFITSVGHGEGGDSRKRLGLPGAGGAPEIAGSAKSVLIILKQSARSFVDKLDFITSVGHGEGGDSRKRLGLPGAGPVGIITDLCIMEPEEGTHEFVVTALHPGVTREQVVAATGWAVRFADTVENTAEPTEVELTALRDLEARTAAAHGQAPGEA